MNKRKVCPTLYNVEFNERHAEKEKVRKSKKMKVGAIVTTTNTLIGSVHCEKTRYKVIEMLDDNKTIKVVKEGYSCPRYTFRIDELMVVE